MKWARALAVPLVLLGMAGSAAGQAFYEPEQPGSVLVFPKFLTGALPDGTPRSSFEISVTCPAGRSCPEFTDAVKMKALWVCGEETQLPQKKRICRATDFELYTTVKGTLWFNPVNSAKALSPNLAPRPEGTNVRTPFVPAPPCTRGYLIVWVINQLDQPISFNGLVGNAVIRRGTADSNSYNAIPVQSPSGPGAILSQDPNDNLRFDGNMYALVSGTLYGTVRYERAGSPEIQTTLTLMTLDTRVNRPNLVSFVPLVFYNENERPISTAVEFICWTEKRLTQINRNFTQGFGGLGAQKGLVEASAIATQQNTELPFDTFPATLLGLIETSEWDITAPRGNIDPGRSYAYGVFHDGVGVPTRFCPIASAPCPVP